MYERINLYSFVCTIFLLFFSLITNGNILLNTTTTNTTCGYSNGIIVASASGGTAPYTYQSYAAQRSNSSGIFPDLAAGAYDITAFDATGAKTTITVTLTNTFSPPGIGLSSVTSPSGCSTVDGSLTLSASGGLPPYMYSINDGLSFQSSNSFANLSAGSYNFFIKDANGCIATSWGGAGIPYTSAGFNSDFSSYYIVSNCSLQFNISATSVITCGSDGFIKFYEAQGGTPPYQYSLDGTNFAPNPADGYYFLKPGRYTIYVRDSKGMTTTVSADLIGYCFVSATTTAATCGGDNGSIDVTTVNGIAPYTFSIDGIHFQVSNVFTGLSPGSYTVIVKDVNRETGAATVTVTGACPTVTAAVTGIICGSNTGTITAIGANGTPPYQYSIDGIHFQTSPDFTGLSPGTYIVTVKDAGGLTSTTSVSIGSLNNNLALNAGSNVTICAGTGAKLMATSNGTNFSWTPVAGLDDSTDLNPVASPPETTKYYITASSGTCSLTDSVIVFVNPAPIADAGKDSTICFGQSTQLQGAGGISYVWAPSTYLDDPGISDPYVIGPVSSIVYRLNVRDVNGCVSVQKADVTITVTPEAKVFAGNDTSIAIDQPLQLRAEDVNNSGFSEFLWSPSYGLNNPVVQNPVATTDIEIKYTVIASTTNGCSDTGQISIKVYKGPDIYVPNAFTPNNDGHDDILRAIPIGIKDFRYFMVYNRQGLKVFYTSNPAIGWDGRIGSILQRTNTFVWIAEGVDYKGNTVSRKGTVTLIR